VCKGKVLVPSEEVFIVNKTCFYSWQKTCVSLYYEKDDFCFGNNCAVKLRQSKCRKSPDRPGQDKQ